MTAKKTALKASTPESQQMEAHRLSEQAIRKHQLAHRWRAADGRSAFGELSRAAHGDRKGRDRRRLGIEDASILAGRLYDFLQEVGPQLKGRGVSRGELCRRAGLCGRSKHSADRQPEDAKELHRLTLPPGVDARKRGIRVGAWKYLNVVEVLAAALDGSVEHVADRLLRGTSLHPLSKTASEWSDMDKIQALLQRMVNDVDRDFGLTQLFQRTAELKSKWNFEGSHVSWPLYGPDHPEGDSARDLDKFRDERVAAMDPKQAFYRRNQFFGQRTDMGWWLYGFDTDALQGDDFFYVPHAQLGHMLIWDLPDRREDQFAYELAVKRKLEEIRRDPANLALPDDGWDGIGKCPAGQTGTRNWRLQSVFWLLAYPHPDGGRLVPTLYMAGEEGGAYMVPLDIEVLDTLSDAVWVSGTHHCSVIERLLTLLVEKGKDGLNPIERNMRRTAEWMPHNPVLKRQREREDHSGRLDEVFRIVNLQRSRRRSKG